MAQSALHSLSCLSPSKNVTRSQRGQGLTFCSESLQASHHRYRWAQRASLLSCDVGTHAVATTGCRDAAETQVRHPMCAAVKDPLAVTPCCSEVPTYPPLSYLVFLAELFPSLKFSTPHLKEEYHSNLGCSLGVSWPAFQFCCVLSGK